MLRKLLLASLLMSWTVVNAGISQAAPLPNTTNPNPNYTPAKKPHSSLNNNSVTLAQTYFAVVANDGKLVRGLDVSSSQTLGTGFYEVIFKHDVTACAFVATLGTTNSLGTEPTGQITVAGRYANNNGVFIATTDSNGISANRNFHLVVTC